VRDANVTTSVLDPAFGESPWDLGPWWSAGKGPDSGDVRKRRIASLVVIGGGVGMLVGRPLIVRSPPDPEGYADSWLPLNLILLGLAAWHYRRFRLEKLVAIGLLAAGALMFTLGDVGSGPPAWDRGYSGDELVGIWLFTSSAALVLIGVLWSSFSERPAGNKTLWSYFFGKGPGGSKAVPSQRGLIVDEGQSPPEGWWKASDGRWYPPELQRQT
jgi:hypothetical protein